MPVYEETEEEESKSKLKKFFFYTAIAFYAVFQSVINFVLLIFSSIQIIFIKINHLLCKLRRKNAKKRGKLQLIVDLDETLIYSTLNAKELNT
jgi:hypothetical protein